MTSWFASGRERCWALYRRYYNDKTYKHHQTRYREEIRRHLKPDMRILDAGCGREFPFTKEFVAEARMAVGIDMTELKPGLAGVCGVRADLQRLPFKDNSFDMVISMSVLEHLQEPEKVFHEFSRVLRPNGMVILQTPNRYDYVSLIANMTPFWFHRFILARLLGREEEDTFPTFFRANTKSQLQSLFRQAHLTPVKMELFNQYPAYLMFSSLLFRLGVCYERLTSRYAALEQLRGWILPVAQKRE